MLFIFSEAHGIAFKKLLVFIILIGYALNFIRYNIDGLPSMGFPCITSKEQHFGVPANHQETQTT